MSQKVTQKRMLGDLMKVYNGSAMSLVRRCHPEKRQRTGGSSQNGRRAGREEAIMPIQVMVVPVWVERLGWTLVHSLWQLAVVAILAAVLLRLLRNGSTIAVRSGGRDAGLDGDRAGATWCLVSVEPIQRVSQ